MLKSCNHKVQLTVCTHPVLRLGLLKPGRLRSFPWVPSHPALLSLNLVVSYIFEVGWVSDGRWHEKRELSLTIFAFSPIVSTWVLNLQDLMPEDLRWSWCNNNRNKVHKKCNWLESSSHKASPHHPQPLPQSRKTLFHKTGPWCQKVWGPLLEHSLYYATLVTASL